MLLTPLMQGQTGRTLHHPDHRRRVSRQACRLPCFGHRPWAVPPRLLSAFRQPTKIFHFQQARCRAERRPLSTRPRPPGCSKPTRATKSIFYLPPLPLNRIDKHRRFLAPTRVCHRHRYLQKLEEPKKEENRTFRAKFLMNSYVLAKDAMQSFNFGPGEKKSKKTPIRPYNGKVVCSHCKRQQIEKPPRWWPKGRARRETMEWCKREVVDDQIPGQAGHAQTIQRLMLCPLHGERKSSDKTTNSSFTGLLPSAFVIPCSAAFSGCHLVAEEDLIERDPNWLDGTVLLSKTTVLRHCKEADSDRAAISSDGFERCLSAVGRVGRTLSTLPDQIPEGIPGWTRPLTMILMATIAILFAWILPAAQANSRYAPELSPGEERVTVDHAFLQPDVRAVVVELDYGTVSIVSGGSGHAAQFEISITASPGGAGSQPVEVALMPDVAGSGGVLHVTRAGTGAWAALSRAATAETTLAVEVRIPTSLSLAHQHALTIEVTIGRNRVLPTSMAEDGVGDGNDGKLAAPGRLLLPSGDRDGTGAAGLVASTAEANGITWVGTPNGGETSGPPELGTMWLKRVSLSTLDGKIEARQLRSQVVRVASSSGTISLQGATSNSVSVSSGSAANGGPVEVIGLTLTSQAPWRTSGPTAATSGGGSLHLWSLNAPLTRISLINDDASPVGVGGTLELPYPLNESAFGGGGGSAATAASVDVTCGGGVVPGNTCELEVPIRLCGEYMGDAAAAATGVGAQASATALLAFGAGIAAPHESSTGVGSISDDTFASQRVVLPCDNAGQELKGWAQIRAHSSGATLRLLTRS